MMHITYLLEIILIAKPKTDLMSLIFYCQFFFNFQLYYFFYSELKFCFLQSKQNLIEKPSEDEPEIARENAITLVQCKVLKHLEILQQSGQKFDDPDIIDDIEFLYQKLQESIQDLSSFDEYSTEVRSGRLEWSPVHTTEKFWRENAARLNEKNYELLKILIRLLEASNEPMVLAVAAHDIGEYVRHYPRGKV